MEPVWILESTVLKIHQLQIAEHGGSHGLRDQGLLVSALAKPKNLYAYTEASDLAALAASYAYGIARNHPFLDGNKRTAFVVCRTFLKLNGADLKATAEDKYETFLRLAEGGLAEADLATWIRDRLDDANT